MTAVKEIKELTWQQKKRKAFQKLTISDLKAIYDFANIMLNDSKTKELAYYSQVAYISKGELETKIKRVI